MRLITYLLKSDKKNQWNFDQVKLGRVNLIVGDSGTGKTRFLNTIINFFSQLVSDKVQFIGNWEVEFINNGIEYRYCLNVEDNPEDLNEKHIVFESLTEIITGKLLFERNIHQIFWKNNLLPKLSSNIACFKLLNDEDEMKAIYKNIKRIIARRFSGDELNTNFMIRTIPAEIENNIVKNGNVYSLNSEPINYHYKLSLLKSMDINKYNHVVNLIKSAFPFISEVDVQMISQIIPRLPIPIHGPVVCFKELGMDNWIPANDISSGMQKTFLLILDTVLLEENGMLIIDEYENSLGVNAINFLPDIINDIGDKCQFIITSHHPYIINNLPIETWKVFHRSGMHVSVVDGIDLKSKYSKSKQEYFTQLLNDPIYSVGIR